MVVKVKEKIEKRVMLKITKNLKKCVLRGERNVRYQERILSNKNKSYNLTTK